MINIAVVVELIKEGISLVRADLEDRKSQRDFDREMITALDPNDADDKAIIRRYVDSIVKRDEMKTKNWAWWQKVADKIGDLFDGDLIDEIRKALKGETS